jgi:hypothetical protein
MGPPLPHPPQSGPPGPPRQMGTLGLTIQGNAMSSNMISPAVTLNGYPVPTSYGSNALPVQPGRIRVAVSSQWMRTYGQAEIDVDVAPGQTVQLWYAPPWHQFTTGNIGYEKQKRKGAGFFVGLMAVIILLPILLVLLAVL